MSKKMATLTSQSGSIKVTESSTIR